MKTLTPTRFQYNLSLLNGGSTTVRVEQKVNGVYQYLATQQTQTSSGTYELSFVPNYQDIRISVSGTSRYALNNLYLDRDQIDTLISTYALSRGYRYGFQGQEKDDEVSGKGNSYTAEFWQYDSRLGRRWNRDPKPNPSISNYACFANNPILYSDPYGDTVKVEGDKKDIGKFVRQLSSVTGNKYKVDKNGILFNKKGVDNLVTTKRKSGELSGIVKKVMEDEETFILTLSRHSGTAYYDNYDTGEVDVGEFKQSNRIFRAGQFAHLFEERWSNSPDYSIQNRTDYNYDSSHDCGMIAEATVVCGMLKMGYSYPASSRSLQESVPDSRGDTYMYFWETTRYGTARFGGKRTAIKSEGGRFQPGGNLITKMKLIK